MIATIKQTQAQATRALNATNRWIQDWLTPALLRRRTFGIAFVASLLAILYWGVLASDRYVSEAHIVIQRTELASSQAMDFGSLLGGMGNGNRTDQLLLRDYLLSLDMLAKLDAKLDLRTHYSSWRRDPLSRLWFKNTPQEKFHEYYLSRVSVELDEYAGVLVIKAQAYDPEFSRAIVSLLVEEGERFMNELVHRLAQEQVTFLEKQIALRYETAMQARQAVLEYQNRKGLLSPQHTAESRTAIISGLEGQLVQLQAQRSALLGYLSPEAPGVVELDLRISAVEKQIAKEQAQLTSTGNATLNRTVEEFQRLQLAADFAMEVYKTALVALEKGRVEATRTIKKLSVLQTPTLPQYPQEPRRLYSIAVFVLFAMFLAGIVHMLAAIIRDHKD